MKLFASKLKNFKFYKAFITKNPSPNSLQPRKPLYKKVNAVSYREGRKRIFSKDTITVFEDDRNEKEDRIGLGPCQHWNEQEIKRLGKSLKLQEQELQKFKNLNLNINLLRDKLSTVTKERDILRSNFTNGIIEEIELYECKSQQNTENQKLNTDLKKLQEKLDLAEKDLHETKSLIGELRQSSCQFKHKHREATINIAEKEKIIQKLDEAIVFEREQ